MKGQNHDEDHHKDVFVMILPYMILPYSSSYGRSAYLAGDKKKTPDAQRASGGYLL